jgi:hypothetical protein
MLIYPGPAVITNAIIPAMMARRSADTARDVRAARTAHLWALACTTADTTSGTAYTVVDLDADVVGSPILAAAEELIVRLAGRQIWGFGLVRWTRGELFTSAGGMPEELLRALAERSLGDRPSADDLCAATVFDSRGRSYNAVTYRHLPDLGVIGWQENTLMDSASIDAWVDRFGAGVVPAHAWVLAMAQERDRNRSVLQRINQPSRH